MQVIKLLCIIIFLSSVFSCSMNYEDIEIAQELGNDIPDNVIENFSYTSVDNGNIIFRLYSKEAENYSQRNETILTKVVFREYNTKNEIVTEGTADRGLIHTDSDNAELTGSLIIYSAENEAEITADYLYWNDSEKTLKGSEEGYVKLLKNSGTRISGSGFTGDMRSKNFSFDKNVQGIYHYEDD